MVKLLLALLPFAVPMFCGEIQFSLRGLRMVCLTIDHLPTDLEKRHSFRRAKFVTDIQLQLRKSGLVVTDCTKPSAEEWGRLFPDIEAPQDVRLNAVPQLSLSMDVFTPDDSKPYWSYDVSLSLIELAHVARTDDPISTATWRKAVYGTKPLSQLMDLQAVAYALTEEFVHQWLSDNPIARPPLVTRHTK